MKNALMWSMQEEGGIPGGASPDYSSLVGKGISIWSVGSKVSAAFIEE